MTGVKETKFCKNNFYKKRYTDLIGSENDLWYY